MSMVIEMGASMATSASASDNQLFLVKVVDGQGSVAGYAICERIAFVPAAGAPGADAGAAEQIASQFATLAANQPTLAAVQVPPTLDPRSEYAAFGSSDPSAA